MERGDDCVVLARRALEAAIRHEVDLIMLFVRKVARGARVGNRVPILNSTPRGPVPRPPARVAQSFSA
jgi:hypothetical protein